MQMDPRAVAARIGIRGERLVPSIVNCPLCDASGKLELRSFQVIQCRGCGFVGDLISLHARVKNESIDATVASLTSRGILNMDGISKAYIESKEHQERIQKLITKNVAMLAAAAPPSYLAVLDLMRSRLFSQTPEGLRRHLVPLFREDIKGLGIPLPDDADMTLKWWGKYGAVAVPAYDGSDVVGFFLLTTKGNRYLPLSLRKVAANAFALIPAMSDRIVFVVDTIETAVRMTIWSAMHFEKPYGFVVPEGIKDSPEHYMAKKVVFWSQTEEPVWTLRSRHCNTNYVLFNSMLSQPDGTHPCGGDFTRFLEEADRLAVPTFDACARHLLDLPIHKATEALAAEILEPGDRAKIVAYATGEGARTLQGLMATQPARTIDWSGTLITETESGWVAKGKTISSVVFYMEELRTCADDAIVIGSIVHKGKSIKFQEKLSVLRKNPAAWLESFAVRKFGVIAYIERAWRNRLLDISQQFKHPDAVMEEQRYGWHEHTLRLPMFYVDNKDTSPAYEVIAGPRISLPTPFSLADKDAFDSESFCRLFLVLLKNIWDTKAGNGNGWLLINQPHIVERTAQTFGMELQLDPEVLTIQSQLRDPILTPTVLGPKSLAHVLNTAPPANLMASTDTLNAWLAYVFSGWPLLNVEHHVEYRCLAGIFHVVQAMLAKPVQITRYRDLAGCVADCFGVKGRLATAGMSLDLCKHASQSSTPSKFVEILVKMHAELGLVADVKEDRVIVSVESFYAIAARSRVQVPDAKEIAHMFAATEYLIGFEKDWVFSSEGWNFHQCLTHAN